MKVLAARGVKPRLRGMGAPEIIVCCHIKALLLNPPQGEARRKEKRIMWNSVLAVRRSGFERRNNIAHLSQTRCNAVRC